jgi:hypothetical protein
MPSYPYAQPISGLEQIITHLRKSYSKELNASVLKSLEIAPNNESYIVNTLRTLGLFDQEGKAVETAREIFVKSGDEFTDGFAEMIKAAYSGLFELHADEAWSLPKAKLVSFFRTADKSSELVGNRQADTFIKLAEIAQKREATLVSRPVTIKQPKKSENSKGKSTGRIRSQSASIHPQAQLGESAVALTVRIEINLPAGGDQSTYDTIFKSIRQQLIDRE